VTFLFFSALVLYSTFSSLVGKVPDGIPILSDAVSERVPTSDMFDETGTFIPRDQRKKKKKDDEDKE
jgi:hypothetical protein